jgi:hypothetical protein
LGDGQSLRKQLGECQMFTTLPKSRAAEEKAARLSPLELAHLDMCVTAAFTRPDSYIRVIEYFRAPLHGSVFDFYHIELAEMAFILVVSRTGKMAILDFVLFDDLTTQPPQPHA